MNESKEHNVYKPCEHVTRYKSEALGTYEILHAYFVACIARNDALDLKRNYVKCLKRECKIRSRIHACLFCEYFGCFKVHIQSHSKKKNHSLSMDTTFGALFCYICKDFQYDKDFENVSRKQFSSPVCPRGLIYNKLTPSIEQINILKEHDIIDITDIELRGFLNLGNICYVSCIFQALMHAPVFRNYFLSLKHKCDAKPGFQVFRGKIIQNAPSCYLCEVSKIVLECFSGKVESFMATDFMHLLWLSKFESYEMEDACDFYGHLLESLHSALIKGKPSSGQNCDSDIDVIFSGSQKNVHTCKKCGNVSSQNNQFKCVYFHSKPELKSDSNNSKFVTFKDCLEKSLHSVVEDYHCGICKEKKPNDDETIYERFPLICCFVKTFCREKKTTSTNGKKVVKNEIPEADKNLMLRFEEYFDMTPYKYSLEQRRKSCGKIEPDPFNFFYLFAVVEHTGTATKGHYKSYVRRNKSDWFLCDDDKVEPITLEGVKKINPYCLFYQRPVDEHSRLLLSRSGQKSKHKT